MPKMFILALNKTEKEIMEDFINFYIGGAGETLEQAAVDFVANFDEQFPKDIGTYELIIKSPLSRSFETFHGANKKMHIFRLRGSFKLINKQIFETK